MNYISIAGIALVVLSLLMLFVTLTSNASRKKREEGGMEVYFGSAAETMSRADISLVTAVGSLVFFALLWFGGNIIQGNVVAITQIMIWVDMVNGDMIFVLPAWVVALVGGAPSVGLWYYIHFKEYLSKEDGELCILVNRGDWLLNSIGFYSSVMPLGVPPSGWMNASIVLSFCVFAAWLVGVWGERMLHDSIMQCQRLLVTPLEERHIAYKSKGKGKGKGKK